MRFLFLFVVVTNHFHHHQQHYSNHYHSIIISSHYARSRCLRFSLSLFLTHTHTHTWIIIERKYYEISVEIWQDSSFFFWTFFCLERNQFSNLFSNRSKYNRNWHCKQWQVSDRCDHFYFSGTRITFFLLCSNLIKNGEVRDIECVKIVFHTALIVIKLKTIPSS